MKLIITPRLYYMYNLITPLEKSKLSYRRVDEKCLEMIIFVYHETHYSYIFYVTISNILFL